MFQFIRLTSGPVPLGKSMTQANKPMVEARRNKAMAAMVLEGGEKMELKERDKKMSDVREMRCESLGNSLPVKSRG